MKYSFVIIVSVILWACRNNNTSKIATDNKDSMVNNRDTLLGRNIDIYPSLQTGILIDTIDIKTNRRHTGINIIMPIISKKKYSWVYQRLDSIKKSTIKEFLDEVKDDSVYEENGSKQGYSMWIKPKSLYKNDSTISFILLNGMDYSGMPSTYSFNTISFDSRLKRKIHFSDYFILDTPADSNSLSKIISSIVYNKDYDEAKNTGSCMVI